MQSEKTVTDRNEVEVKYGEPKDATVHEHPCLKLPLDKGQTEVQDTPQEGA